ncbi:MAG: polysaccharide pyruvyl transferase family protein, partial [Bacteroidetes bacterium]|nr:polysaccharide pyruvyl transferase family protein [Bacteroidota bacterium]
MSKIKKRILFAGAYGIENAGDDLPLIVMCEYLKNNYPKIDFTFHAFSRHPNRQEEKAYGVTMIKNLEYNSRDDAKGKWFKGLNFGDDKSDLERISKEISKSDLLILGAGNFFIDLTIDIFRGPIPLFAIYIFIAKIFHVPVMLYGISAGPIKTTWGSYLTRWIVENVDIVTVRDEESKIVLEKILYTPKKIVVLPDSTIGVRENNDRRAITILEQESIPKTGKKRIAIGLRDLTSVLGADKSKKATLELAKLLSKLGQEYE